MIEAIIRRAIIWAITIAVVAGVTKAVTTATKNAMSKSLQGKLESLGIDPNNPDQELMGQLIDVQVVRRGAYFVTVKENVYGHFGASFTARNKEDAIRSLGKKVFGFVNINRDQLTKEEFDFYMTIWFETFAKESLQTKLHTTESRLSNLHYEIDNKNMSVENSLQSIKSLKEKNQKFEAKKAAGKNATKLDKKISRVNEQIVDLNKDISESRTELVQLNDEYGQIKNKVNDINSSIEHPVFINNKKTLGLKGLVLTK